MNSKGSTPMSNQAGRKRIIVGISGASGALYGVEALKLLRAMPEVESHLIISEGARRTMALELDEPFETVLSLADVVHDNADLAAPVASGSFPVHGMIVAPCSVRTLSAIAHHLADNLLIRAADVTLKERRPLVLMVRETPLHAGHIRSMALACEAGAVIFPPVPALYARPASIAEMVRHSVSRALSLLGLAVPDDTAGRWTGA